VIVSAAEFSRMAGVSKVAVSKAPALKIVKREDGKIDTGHPTNALYLAQHKDGAKPTPAPKPKATKTRVEDPSEKAERAEFQKAVAKRQAKKLATVEGVDLADLSPTERKNLAAMTERFKSDLGEAANLPIEKFKADIALKKAMTLLHEFKLAQAKKNVISKEEFRRTAENWNQSLSQNVMRVPRRVIARLWSMAKSGADRSAGELELEKALNVAVTRALEGVANAR